MRSAGHVAHVGGQERCIQGFVGGELRERDHLQDLGVDGWIILKWVFRNWDGDFGLD